MRKYIITGALLCGASTALAQTPPEKSLIDPPTPLEIVREFSTTSQTFEAYYNSMVAAGKDFGAEPKYDCGTSIDGSKECHYYTTFVHNDFAVGLTDILWANGKRNHTVCVSKPFDTIKVCNRDDGELWTQDNRIITKVYRQKW